MSKNPFVNCKSRKRRRFKVSNPIPKEERPYCPRTMVRYDGCKVGYSTVWVCKMCMKLVLSEQAVPTHIETCKLNFLSNRPEKPAEVKIVSVEDSKYICEVCDRVFSRKVALKQHLEVHTVKMPSDVEESDAEPAVEVYVEPIVELDTSEQLLELPVGAVAEPMDQLQSDVQCEPTTLDAIAVVNGE